MSAGDPDGRLAFVICTEAGVLERQSLMLVETIRRFGGRFSDCRILSYSPRRGRAPRPGVLRSLERAGVETVVEPINRRFAEYGFGNKVVACAHAEEEHPHDRLVFLDSDTLVLGEPAALWSPADDVVKLRPVERKLAGSTGSDEYAEYWGRLFDRTGVAEPLRVETSLTGERIYGYWNAGVISAPGRSGFFGRWLRTFRELLDDDLVHPRGMTFMDQVALALTVQQPGCRIEELPAEYNFPVNALVQPPEERPHRPDPLGPERVVIAHYHKVFDRYPLRNPLRPWMAGPEHRELRRIVRGSGLVGPVSWLRHRLHYRLGWDFLAP